jgi:hypothetical protein
MTTTRKRLWTAFALLAVAAGGFWLGRARADGVPASDALYYSGTLDEGAGPVTGKRTLQVTLASTTEGTPLCTSGGEDVMVTGGRFRIRLTPECIKAVHESPDLYAGVVVGTTPLPRRKVGAVPYALEAARASEAVGNLEARIKKLEMQPAPGSVIGRSGFYAYGYAGGTQDVPDEKCVALKFQVENYDYNEEYDPSTGKFTAKEPGLYQVTCSIMFDTGDPNGGNALHVVAVVKNGFCTTDIQALSSSFYGNSLQAAVHTTGLVKLGANEFLTCVAYQTASGTVRTLKANAQYFQSRNYFNVLRVL